MLCSVGNKAWYLFFGFSHQSPICILILSIKKILERCKTKGRKEGGIRFCHLLELLRPLPSSMPFPLDPTTVTQTPTITSLMLEMNEKKKIRSYFLTMPSFYYNLPFAHRQDAPMAARAAGGAVSGMLQHFPQSIDGMPTNNGSAGAGARAGPAAVTSVAGVTTALPSAAEMAPATVTAAAPALGAFMAAGAAAVANTADAAAVQETDQDAERNKWRYDPFQAAKKMRQATKLQLVAAKEKCNCKHSKCLKLYCECFRRGEYCTDCNCKNCTNNVENETARKEAVVSCTVVLFFFFFFFFPFFFQTQKTLLRGGLI